jgi:probable phosphoglycerate mutase
VGVGRIYLARHFATAADDEEQVIAGQDDDKPLSARGQDQAVKLMGKMPEHFKEAYASPTTRTMQTAEIIIGENQTRLHANQKLVEAYAGTWEGKTWEEAEQLGPPGHVAALNADPWVTGYPGGENLSAVCLRVLPLLWRLAEVHEDHDVLVVTHKQVMRAIISFLGPNFIMAAARKISVPLGSYAILGWDGELFLESVDIRILGA